MTEPTKILLEKIQVGGATAEGEAGFFDTIDENNNTYRFIVPAVLISPLHEALNKVQGAITAQRKKAQKPPFFEITYIKTWIQL